MSFQRLALGILLGLSLTSSFASAGPARAGGEAQLGVMTVNLWHRDRPAELKIMAQRLAVDLPKVPDFILCQEVVFGRNGQDPNTAAVLARELGYHARGTKRTSDGEGIAIVSRYPFTHYGERHLKSQTSRLLIGFRRVSVMGEFDVPAVGRVRVVNVHFTNWGFEHHIRRRQLAETLEWIAQRQAEAPAAVTLLGGDFNAKRGWNEMKQMDVPASARHLEFSDFNGTEFSMGSPGRPNKRIDYVFIAAPRMGVKFEGEKVLWKDGLPKGKDGRFFISDHLSVVHSYTVSPQLPVGPALTDVRD